MSTVVEITALMQHEGAALYGDDSSARDRLELQISDLPFQGLALAAPAHAERGHLPLVLACQQTARRGWEVGAHNNLLLAVANRSSGALSVVPALQNAKDDEFARNYPGQPVRSPPPDEAETPSLETSLRRLDLERLAPSAFAPGRLAITAIAFDQRSNSAEIELPGTPAHAPHAISPLPDPDMSGRVSYFIIPDPEVAPGSGARFRVAARGRGSEARLVLTGTVGTTLKESDLLPKPVTVEDRGEPRKARAVFPMSLVIVGLDLRGARVQTFGVPVYRQVAAGSAFALGFRIELGGAMAAPLPAKSLAYLFIDGRIEGPQLVEGP